MIDRPTGDDVEDLLDQAGQFQAALYATLSRREHAHRVFNATQALAWGLAQRQAGFDAGQQCAFDSEPGEVPR